MANFHFFWHGPFSQWSMDSFSDEHRTYNCCEQYMMAQKAILFNDQETLDRIMQARSPKQQKALGRQVKNFDNKLWERKARIIVYNGNYLRFSQNKESMKMLMETKGTLVEASPYDKIWGIGLSADDPDAKNVTKWRGKNWLGKVLTLLREDFRENKAEIISLEKDWIYLRCGK